MELGQGTKKDEGGRRRRTSSGDDGGGGGSDDHGGTRQPYNCTFCKRGFPTAQALGGHMNAHRKMDRGRAPSTPTTVAAAAAARSTPTTLVDAFTGHGAQDRLVSGAGGSSLRRADERAPQELRLFGHVDGGAGRGEEGSARDRREYRDANDGNGDDHGEQGDEEGLDLELRLGAAGQ